MLRHDVDNNVKGCNVCLASKVVQHKPYGHLQSLPIPSYCWKDLLMDFVTGLPISTDWKRDSYDSILVIVNRLTKIVYYKPVKVTIHALGLAEVIIDVVVRYHGLLDLIVTDRESLFTSKFWSSLCYFFDIKRRLSTAFHPQMDGQTERQNSTIEAYPRAFINLSRMIGHSFFPWWNSLTAMPRMPASATHRSSSIADIILASPMKKT